jgi:hypothetical protein
MAALNAAALPPPGTGFFDAVFSKNSVMLRFASIILFLNQRQKHHRALIVEFFPGAKHPVFGENKIEGVEKSLL